MKPIPVIAVIFVLACVTLPAVAQIPKTVVNCWIQGGKVNYGHLSELLPDSVTTNLLIDVHKKLNTSDGNVILLWLEQQGWETAGRGPADIPGSMEMSAAILSMILSKELDLDDTARTLFLQKLENLNKKKLTLPAMKHPTPETPASPVHSPAPVVFLTRPAIFQAQGHFSPPLLYTAFRPGLSSHAIQQLLRHRQHET